MLFYGERMKLIVEPTGCLSLSGLMNSGIDVRGKRVGVVISGGNVDIQKYATLISSMNGEPKL